MMKVERAEYDPIEGAPGFSLVGLNRGTEPERVRVDVAHLAAGATIPRHRAGREQVFYLVSGRGRVAGAEGLEVSVQTGSSVIWEYGEEHQTWADTDITAVIVQRGGV